MIARRQFTFLSGAAAAWPLAATAQQQVVPVVGFLHNVSADTQEGTVAAFRRGLSEIGFIEGRNIAIEFRFANNDYNRLPELAADLVRRRVAVIAAMGGAVSTRAAKAATANIPIVFVQGEDPVAMGIVASMNRPSGNATGVSFMSTELGPKRLGLLKELVPKAMLYAVLVNPDSPTTHFIVADLRAAAASIARQIEVFTANSILEIDTAFAELVRRGADALVVGGSALFASRGTQLATLAALHRLPAVYYSRRAVEVGGLMSYGANIQDAVRQGGMYAGRILKGEKPADLPVLQPTKFEFVINLQTARSFGIEVPATLLALADEVIE